MVFTRIVQPGQRRKYKYLPGQSLLFRLSGTVIPKVWPMMVWTALLTFVLCLVYNPLRNKLEKKDETPVFMGQWEKVRCPAREKAHA